MIDLRDRLFSRIRNGNREMYRQSEFINAIYDFVIHSDEVTRLLLLDDLDLNNFILQTDFSDTPFEKTGIISVSFFQSNKVNFDGTIYYETVSVQFNVDFRFLYLTKNDIDEMLSVYNFTGESNNFDICDFKVRMSILHNNYIDNHKLMDETSILFVCDKVFELKQILVNYKEYIEHSDFEVILYQELYLLYNIHNQISFKYTYKFNKSDSIWDYQTILSLFSEFLYALDISDCDLGTCSLKQHDEDIKLIISENQKYDFRLLKLKDKIVKIV